MSKSWIGGRQLQKLRALVISTYGLECHLCHQLIDTRLPGTHPQGFSIDHVIPRAHGGSNAIGNLRPAHRQCNTERGTKYVGQRRQPSWVSDFF
ncbi:HNH endonuclease [Arcanobacterium haemolyticum]